MEVHFQPGHSATAMSPILNDEEPSEGKRVPDLTRLNLPHILVSLRLNSQHNSSPLERRYDWVLRRCWCEQVEQRALVQSQCHRSPRAGVHNHSRSSVVLACAKVVFAALRSHRCHTCPEQSVTLLQHGSSELQDKEIETVTCTTVPNKHILWGTQ
jgi:hypothetical protein